MTEKVENSEMSVVLQGPGDKTQKFLNAHMERKSWSEFIAPGSQEMQVCRRSNILDYIVRQHCLFMSKVVE